MPTVSRVGGRLPAYCTATGKLFLALGPAARLEDVLSAGLVRHTPHTIISITGNVCRPDLGRLAPAVRTAALALSREPARETAGGLKMGIPR
ncbi:IclR family transcriptional regulator C-terminal domain-containing protein [Actinomadura sp. GTD37]|uniref:IclR family transcriptional regulator domain-containing protein n=1 Tax=Actinomadura sp. GTD37 TaxID=1778030 RepID=UPI0035C10514